MRLRAILKPKLNRYLILAFLLISIFPVKSWAVAMQKQVAPMGGKATNESRPLATPIMGAKGMAIAPEKPHFTMNYKTLNVMPRVCINTRKAFGGTHTLDGKIRISAKAKSKTSKTRPGQTSGIPPQRVTNQLGMVFRYISAGIFQMGSNLSPGEVKRRWGGETKWFVDEHPRHQVTISEGFYLQTTEVTVGQWRQFANATSYRSEAETDDSNYAVTGKWEKKANRFWDNPGFDQTDQHPVTCISWTDAQKFIQWLSRTENERYRLPTEAEWEYAARAGTTTSNFWGDNANKACEFANISDVAAKKGHQDREDHSCNDGSIQTAPVGRFTPNAWGMHDMIGNVWEWCQDWYGAYPKESVANPKGPSSGSLRVLRGGGWYSFAHNCRSASRDGVDPGHHRYLGFRLALSINQ